MSYCHVEIVNKNEIFTTTENQQDNNYCNFKSIFVYLYVFNFYS